MLFAVRLTLIRILSPASNPQVDGSAPLAAVAFCHDDWEPVDTETGEPPQEMRPLPLLSRYTWYVTLESALSVRPISEVEPATNSLNVEGSWYVTKMLRVWLVVSPVVHL